jgi:hypothetical protein
MKLFAAALLAATVSTAAWAQYSHRNYGSPGGFGNILFPGTGTQPPLGPATPMMGSIRPFTGFGSSFPQRFGQSIGGFRTYGRGVNRGFGGVAYPIPYPVFVGGWDQGYYQQPEQPNVTVIMPPQPSSQPASPVTIYQNFAPAQPDQGVANPVQQWGPAAGQGEPAPAAAAANDEQTLFLIALKDSSVYTAVAWWVDGGALHYITPQGKHNQVSLDLVDRSVSERLNRGRSVEFRLPQ